jgi:Protein of unknown function (DUF1254)
VFRCPKDGPETQRRVEVPASHAILSVGFACHQHVGPEEGSEKQFGAGYNVLPVWKKRMNAKTLVTTPNSDVIYAMGYVAVGKDGPLVIEVLPRQQGILDDFWQRPLTGPTIDGHTQSVMSASRGRTRRKAASTCYCRPATRPRRLMATSSTARAPITSSSSGVPSSAIQPDSKNR